MHIRQWKTVGTALLSVLLLLSVAANLFLFESCLHAGRAATAADDRRKEAHFRHYMLGRWNVDEYFLTPEEEERMESIMVPPHPASGMYTHPDDKTVYSTPLPKVKPFRPGDDGEGK